MGEGWSTLWAAGAASGVGSLPGPDPLEAARFVMGELSELPHLPELPARGPGADMVGRGAAHLVDLHFDLQPSGWRLIDRPGVDERRARGLLARDLDALEEAAEGYSGPLKVQCAGPWTLAASCELGRGDKVLSDSGAVRDLTASLAEGLVLLVGELSRRIPGASLLVQLDEPSLPAVLAGRVPSASGYSTLAAVPEHEAVEGLRLVMESISEAGGVPVAHCCSSAPPVRAIVAAGARAVSLDAAMLTEADDDAIGEAVDAGVGLLLGLVPSLGPGVPPSTRKVVAPARRLWARLGFEPERLGATVAVTPACGLAGASVGWMNTAYRLCRQAGRALVEAPEDTRETRA